MTIEADMWKTWWKGLNRPFLVLSKAAFNDQALRKEIDAKYPGVEVFEVQDMPRAERRRL